MEMQVVVCHRLSIHIHVLGFRAMSMLKRKRPCNGNDAVVQASSSSELGGSESSSDYSGDLDAESYDSDAGSSEDSSRSSSTSCSLPDPATVKVTNLSFNQVLWGDDDSGSDDAFQQNGKCRKRICKAMRAKCCARGCKRQLCLHQVIGLVTAFWSLQKLSQDALLWSLQHPIFVEQKDESEELTSSSGSEARETLSWYLQGWT